MAKDLFEKLIDPILKIEGGYVNHPSDRGGETNFGITVAVARANGYTGPMRNMPKATAIQIYRKKYWIAPRFDLVAQISEKIAAELFDTGINMGQSVASQFLQLALNGLNRRERDYPDILVDGIIGNQTITTLGKYMARNQPNSEVRMLKLLECQQGARYLNLTINREKNEDFLNGWIDNRISLVPKTH